MKVGYRTLAGYLSTAYLDTYDNEDERVAAHLPFDGEDKYSGFRVTVVPTGNGWVEVAS